MSFRCPDLGALVYTGPHDKDAALAYSLSEALGRERFSVVDVDKVPGRLRVKGIADACTDLSCADADIIAEEGVTKDLETVRPGDIIMMTKRDDRPQEIVVVRHAYEEYSSPAW